MSNIFILGLEYATSTNGTNPETVTQSGSLSVRIGYFGLCARSSEVEQWVCTSGGRSLESIFAGSNTDPLGIIHIGDRFKEDVIFPGLL